MFLYVKRIGKCKISGFIGFSQKTTKKIWKISGLLKCFCIETISENVKIVVLFPYYYIFGDKKQVILFYIHKYRQIKVIVHRDFIK